jgi:glycosyltransferase involved in cell wall biosynthesis
MDYGNVTGSNPYPVSVAYVVPRLDRGGTEKHILDLSSRLDRRRFSPCVISTNGGGAMEGEFRGRGVPLYVLDYKGVSVRPGKALPLLREARSFFSRFAGILSERRVRILHAYLPAANVVGTLAGLLSSVPVRIVSKRALCRYKEGHPVYAFFENLANLGASAIMVNSRAVEEDVRRTERFVGAKTFLVYNGIDVRNGIDSPRGGGSGASPGLPGGIPVPPGAPLVTYVANLREDKAHLCLADAAERVLAAFPEARFLFVGREGCEAAAVRERLAAPSLAERVVMTGPRQDVSAILAASRLVAHPGEQEGFSNAILEAMAAGLPVVAAGCGGNPEAVVDGETGIVVPAGDPAAFAEAILKLLRDPAGAAAMGEAGRRRAAERFSIERMVRDVESFYEKALAS